MEQIEFPQDFSEFLKLPNAHHVEYLEAGAELATTFHVIYTEVTGVCSE
jgi:hypothetical protein